MFFDYKDSYVHEIWFILGISNEEDMTIGKNMFNAICNLGDFIIVDWGWDFIQNIKNHGKVEVYLRERL